ncbi:MAG TPA: hypothetical protein VF548_07180 [Allosphingosinicella sp.]|jgi:hypothetical protein
MGTIGGKVGYGVGIITSVFFAVPVLHIVPGSCFFEGGCGNEEQVGLVVAALILLALALLSGTIARLIANYLLGRQDNPGSK